MITEIETLYRGLSRKIDKAQYSKLRNYNKIKLTDRANLSPSPSVSPPENIKQMDCELSQPSEQFFVSPMDTSNNLQKAKKHMKMIDERLDKLIKTLENPHEKPTSKTIQLLNQIKLEIIATELVEIRDRKQDEHLNLLRKIKKNQRNTHEHLEQKLRLESFDLVQREKKISHIHDSFVQKINSTVQKIKKLENQLQAQQKTNKKANSQLQEAQIRIKQATATYWQRKAKIQSKLSEELVEVKGGELKNSEGLETQIQQMKKQRQAIDRELRNLTEQTTKEKIRLTRSIVQIMSFMNQKQPRKRPSLSNALL